MRYFIFAFAGPVTLISGFAAMILWKSQERVVLVRAMTVGVIVSPLAVEQNESYPQLICLTEKPLAHPPRISLAMTAVNLL